MKTLPSNEHRVETRLDLVETIFIELLAASADHDADSNIIICNSLDMSANGLQVVLDEKIPQGTILRLCIDLKNREPFYLVGEVMWCRPDTETDAQRIGFSLFESDDTDIQTWKEVVAEMLGHTVPPTDP